MGGISQNPRRRGRFLVPALSSLRASRRRSEKPASSCYGVGALTVSIGLIGLLCGATTAYATVTISSAQSSNMSCSNGVCAPTSTDAVLNVGDLENQLSSGSVEVTTTGSGVQANDIAVKAALVWSTSSALSLDAYRSITIDKAVSVVGQGGMSIVTNDGGSGGTLFFGAKGHVSFANLSSALSIDGTNYNLIDSLPALASAIAASPSGSFALATSYDASQDGTYSIAPIATTFTGSFNGLGNTVSSMAINDSNLGDGIGLFADIGTGGSVTSIGIENANIAGWQCYVGGLAGINQGTIQNSFVSGSVAEIPNNSSVPVGGLVGWNYGGTIMRSHAHASVTGGGATNLAGGLVGADEGTITESYSTGAVSTGGTGYGGGLAGISDGNITKSYAGGTVSGRYNSIVGGLLGANENVVAQAYSTGRVKAPDKNGTGYRGGLVGEDEAKPGSISSSYWDTTTSIKNQKRGAGNIRNDPGITGLTTTQFQSRLPDGFDPKTWAENPNINNGLPYLIANPPREK